MPINVNFLLNILNLSQLNASNRFYGLVVEQSSIYKLMTNKLVSI
jgi:hypothetical protein